MIGTRTQERMAAMGSMNRKRIRIAAAAAAVLMAALPAAAAGPYEN